MKKLLSVLFVTGVLFTGQVLSLSSANAADGMKEKKVIETISHSKGKKSKKTPAVVVKSSKNTIPKVFKVKFTTTKGSFVMEVHRDWSPKGVARFHELVKSGFFKDVIFFRVIKGFMAQFGIHGDPKMSSAWTKKVITDDPVKSSNKRGYVSFATSGKDSRTTQMFINFGDNSRLDSMGFSPFAKISPVGMMVVDKIYSGYGEGAPRGRGPSQGLIQTKGNKYLKASFPELDHIKSAVIL